MQFARHVLAFCAVIGTLAVATPLLAATEAPKPAVAKKEVAKDIVLKGDAKCTTCHDEADEPTGAGTMLEINPGVLAIGKTKHGVKADKRTPTCTDCHGESEKHTNHKGSDKPPKVDRSFRKNTETAADVRNDTCMTCHKGGKRMQWVGSQHASSDVACNSCHQVHSQRDKVVDKLTQGEVCFACHKDERAQSNRSSHHAINEGKVACSSCHNPHGSNGPKLLVKNTVVETCYTCHAEKRGPFLWEHPPAADNCLNCHTPHGSNNPGMLKARQPYLCQECHDFTRHPGSPYSGSGVPPTGAAQQLLLRSCANCHTQVHGTNHPSGPRFTR